MTWIITQVRTAHPVADQTPLILAHLGAIGFLNPEAYDLKESSCERCETRLYDPGPAFFAYVTLKVPGVDEIYYASEQEILTREYAHFCKIEVNYGGDYPAYMAVSFTYCGDPFLGFDRLIRELKHITGVDFVFNPLW